jgi:AcrR family transcriptional regulator
LSPTLSPVGEKAMTRQRTRDHILDVTERLLATADSVDDVSVRRIAEEAGTTVSAVGYHFGSRDKLIAAAAKRIYDRFNEERLTLLNAAIDAKAPDPPDLGAVIAALIAPSVRWSNDPTSSYAAFVNFGALVQRAKDPSIGGSIAKEIKHLRAFIPPLRQIAPWFSESEIAWRIHCALGVRSNVIRYRARAEALIGDAFDLTDSEEVLDRMIEVIAPMFRRPSQ